MMLGKEEPGHNRDISIPLMDDEVVMDVEEVAGHDRQYKDVFFLALFGMNILCIISLALLYGVVALSSSGDEVIKVGQNGKEYNQTSEFTPSVEIMFGMIVTLASAVIATSVWIFTLSRIASFVLNAILISLIMVPIICGMVLFFLGYFVFGFTLLLLSVCLLVLSLFIRPRMDFAAVNLRVACTAVLQMPSVFGYAGMAVGVQVLFSILWGIAAVGYATSNTDVTIHAHGLNYDLDECTTYLYGDTLSVPNYGTLTCSGGTCSACVCDGTYISSHACLRPRLYGWAYFWLLVSLFWTSAVVANVVHCTVAAAVARWWEVGYPSHLTVEHGFKRATTTSLGSICFASLLVAVVRSLRSVVHFLSKQLASTQTTGLLRSLQMCLVRVLLYFLALLDRLVVYFNRYALCFVAIHRTDFLTASKTATALFVQRGFTTLLNDDIIDVVLQIGHLIIGIVAMCVGYVYGRLSGVGYAYTVLLTVFGFAAGYLISVVALSTVSSAVATVYVCYVERPLQLQVGDSDCCDNGRDGLPLPAVIRHCEHSTHYALVLGLYNRCLTRNCTCRYRRPGPISHPLGTATAPRKGPGLPTRTAQQAGRRRLGTGQRPLLQVVVQAQRQRGFGDRLVVKAEGPLEVEVVVEVVVVQHVVSLRLPAVQPNMRRAAQVRVQRVEEPLPLASRSSLHCSPPLPLSHRHRRDSA